MVQLNTTYDKDLKQRVFVLKGEEAYARTTDVLASLVSDYADCSTRLNYARVGIEIEVLRNFGDGFIYIYDNNQQIHTYDLPWFDEVSEMESYYNTDEWADKGVTYSNGKLLIGSDSILTSGFNLAYDVEHNIKVKYSGTKYCLGSSSEILSFNMETPKLFTGTLTMESGSDNVYIDRRDATDITLTYTSEYDMSNTKTIQLYINDVLVDDTISLTPDVPTTLSFSGSALTRNSLNTLRAIFLGDDESTYTETSLDISVGCQIDIYDYPTTILKYSTFSGKCTVTDFFGNPITYGTVVAKGQATTTLSEVVSLDSGGKATLSSIHYTSKWRIRYEYGERYVNSEWIDMNVVSITGISLGSNEVYVGNGERTTVTGTVLCDMSCEGIEVQYSYNGTTGKAIVGSNNKFSISITGDYTLSDSDLTASYKGYSDTKTIHNVFSYWEKSVKEINLNYRIVNGRFGFGNVDYMLMPYANSTSQLILGSQFFNPNTDDYEVSFYLTNSFGLTLGVGRVEQNGNFYLENQSVSIPPYNSWITIGYDNGVKYVLVNGESVYGDSVNNGFPAILLTNSTSDDYPFCSLNKLIWKKKL